MSYILDALKKSDKQRVKDKVPDLQTVQEIDSPAKSPKRPVWQYLLVAFLLINTVAFMVWWRPWRSEKITVAQDLTPVTPPPGPIETVQQPKTVPPPAAQAIPSGPLGVNPPTIRTTTNETLAKLETIAKLRPRTPAPNVQHNQAVEIAPAPPPKSTVIPSPSQETLDTLPPDDQPEMSEEEIAAQDELLDQIKTSTEEQGVPEPTFTPPEAVSEPQLIIPETESESVEESAGLPSSARTQPAIPSNGQARSQVIDLMQLPSSIRKDLPEIHIAAHVYSQKPASRLVSINGRVMREGHTLPPGLKLEEITADGVIFSYEGYHFYVGVF